MNILRFILSGMSAVLVAAHFLRSGNLGLAIAPLTFFGLLFTRWSWLRLVAPLLLAVAAVVWAETAYDIVKLRLADGMPWLRLAAILGSVTLLTAAGAPLYFSSTARNFFCKGSSTSFSSALVFCLTAALLAVVQLVVERPMLLLERYLDGGGWFGILVFATYGAWVVEKMADVKHSAVWRKRVWLLFSVLVFGQFLVGVAGVESFLMSGKLHVPIPVVIAAGPIFRGDGFFMSILFVSTVVLVGPAWCSHLCYMGGWDQLASDRKKRPGTLPQWARGARIGILPAIVAAALIMRLAGASVNHAAGLALGFGVVGVGIMIFVSRRLGTMAHCMVFCPIGLLANTLGRMSPFRVRFKSDCDGCGTCALACSYDALRDDHIEAKKVGFNCTLCGDCLGKCKTTQLEYSFGPWKGSGARSAFLVAVVTLHAAFVGVAMI